MLIAFFVNDMAREFLNYTTTVLAHQAVQRGHKVCYITPGDFVMLPDDSMNIHARVAPARKHKSHAEFFKSMEAVGECLRRAFELDLVGADDFAPPRRVA